MTKICSRERSDGYALLLAFQVSHGMYIEYEKVVSYERTLHVLAPNQAYFITVKGLSVYRVCSFNFADLPLSDNCNHSAIIALPSVAFGISSVSLVPNHSHPLGQCPHLRKKTSLK